jgi:hypothetical protein
MDLLRAMIIPGIVGFVVVGFGLYLTRREKPANEAEELPQTHETGAARKEAHHA